MSASALPREVTVPDTGGTASRVERFPPRGEYSPVGVGDISLDVGGNPGFVLRGFNANALRLPSVKLL